MSEMALTADHLVIIGRGRLLADVSMSEMTASTASTVQVRSPRVADLAPLLSGSEVTVTAEDADTLSISGLSSADIAETAFSYGIVLHDVTTVTVSLEDAYLALVHDHLEFPADPHSSPGRAAA
jgi:ABC-2 type transport system ATP-binding protein